ncbi:MAG: MOSC domain-containing protein [Sinobacterium sp.]|nr:MOSC domain-containing protein [Sinobacterium sp.]
MKITELWTYPIKSLQGIAVEKLSFDTLGPELDRRYMLVDDEGQFFSQRRSALLSLVKVELLGDSLSEGFLVSVPKAEGGYEPPIVLNAVGSENIEQLVDVNVWSDSLQAFWQQHALEAPLSKLVGVNLRLVYMSAFSSKTQRIVDRKYQHGEQAVGFADGFPSLICTQASFSAIKKALNGMGDNNLHDFSMQRFRPNIVVDVEEGEGSANGIAFAEDSWSALTNEQVRFDLVKPCSRCVIPTINPRTAKKQAAVWQALKALNSRDGVVYFGQNALHQFFGASQSVSKGDSLRVVI